MNHGPTPNPFAGPPGTFGLPGWMTALPTSSYNRIMEQLRDLMEEKKRRDKYDEDFLEPFLVRMGEEAQQREERIAELEQQLKDAQLSLTLSRVGQNNTSQSLHRLRAEVTRLEKILQYINNMSRTETL